MSTAPRFVGVARFSVVSVGDDARLLDLVVSCVELVRAEHGGNPLGSLPLRDPCVEVLGGEGGVASLVGNTRGLLAFRDALDAGGFEGHGEAWRILRGAVDDAIEGAS